MMNKSSRTKIRWGILSTADIALKQIIPAIEMAFNGEVSAVASRDLDKAKLIVSNLECAKAFGDYLQMLDSGLIDAVYIAVPTGLHFEWASEAAKRGIPCLCEKPLTPTFSEATSLVEKFRENNTLLMEGGMFRYHPLIKRIKSLVENKSLGDIRFIRSSFFVDISNPEDFRLRSDLGGGALLDLGYYCVGIMRHLLAQPVVEICAFPEKGEKQDVDTTTSGLLRFEKGVLGSFDCGFSPIFDCCFKIEGSNGALQVPHGGMVLWPDESFNICGTIDGKTFDETFQATNHYQLMIEDFGECVLGRKMPEFTLEETLDVINILEKLRDSSNKGGVLI